MMSEVNKNSCVHIQIRIMTNIELVRDIPELHVLVNFRNNPIEIATARDSMDRQTDRQTNESAQRATLPKTDCAHHVVNDDVMTQFYCHDAIMML